MEFKIIRSEEIMEYHKIIINHGYKRSFFSISEEKAHTNTTPSNTIPQCGIRVKCKITQQERTYPATVGTLWIKEFEEDLKSGLFRL